MAAKLASDTASLVTARPGLPVRAALLGLLLAIALAGCYKKSVLPQSEGHITKPSEQPAVADVPPPARISTFVPAPKPAVKAPTYTVVVSEVPVKELLFALARDTKQNIDVHPGLAGLVSLNAINETLPGILERISKQVNMRYRIEGQTIIVGPDAPYMKTYRVNYVNMTRDTTSNIGVSGQIQGAGGGGSSSSGGTSGGTSSGGTSGGSNGSNTIVKTTSNNNFWETLRDNIRAILAATRSQNQTADQRAERAETARAQREEKLAQAEAVARAGQGAPQLFASVFGSQATPPTALGDIRDDIVVNAVTGTISVQATDKQHALVQQHIDSVSQVSQRQVLIEATVVEVNLSDAYQGGVDWSRLAISGGVNLTQSLITSLASTSLSTGSLTASYVNPTSSIGNISAMIKLLQQFGNTRVLSSPKMMTLNNQTALLKVVENLVYFSVEAQLGVTTAAGTSQPTAYTTTPQTVPVGMIMSMTPQINGNGQVTLTVRPTITRQNGSVSDPNPSLCSNVPTGVGTGAVQKCITNLVPIIQTREMESVLQLTSGQTAILGGLMTDNSQYLANTVPGAGNPAVTGGLSSVFAMRNDTVSKSELVIFLRATVITYPSLESEELKMFRNLLPKQTETPTETVPGGKAPVAQQ